MKAKTADKHYYLNRLNLDAKTVWREVPKLASELSGDHHVVRSAIIDLHLSVEIEMRRFLYFFLRGMILGKDKEERNKKAQPLLRSVDSFTFGQMWRIMQFAIKGGPWPDLAQIGELSKTRNQVAHGTPVEQIDYRGRNPFLDGDCFAQMYFDAWAISQCFPKLLYKIIEEPIVNSQYYRADFEAYRARYGEIEFDFKYRSPFAD
jgi:hypothetical protein